MFIKNSICLIICLLMVSYVFAQNIPVTIKGQQAKKIFNQLTGPWVKNDAAMSHLYRKGKYITCQYINADMIGKYDRPSSKEDALRYSCTILIDNNGIHP